MLIHIIEIAACFIGGLMLYNISSIIDLLADFTDCMINADRRRKCNNCGTMRRKPDQQFCPTCGGAMNTGDKG